MRETSAWSIPLRVDAIPEEGSHLEVSADEATRAALAREAGVRGVSFASASFDVSRRPGGGAGVSGTVRATVQQICGVSLEPMDNDVVESFALVFMPGAPSPAAAGDDLAARDNVEETEPLIDGHIDLGAIATEFLILGIDLYPRKEGAVLAAPPAQEDRTSPFNVLGALKER